jgi:hypothetical protein
MRFPRLHDRVHGRFIGIDIHGKNEGKLWHRVIVDFPLWVGEKMNDARRWVFYRVHPQHRYNRINLRLPPRYYENDTRLLHGMFSVLCDHIEEEGRKDMEEHILVLQQEIADGSPYSPASVLEDQIALMKEKLALHDWWCVERPAHEKLSRDLSDKLHYVKPYVAVADPENEGQVLTKRQLRERLARMREDNHNKDQEMSHRLVDIRRCLWT